MSNSSIQIDNLKKTFGGLKAVDIEHLTFEEGCLGSIIGPNGAGKTTLFDLISGFQEGDTGEIVYKNKNITRSQPYKISRLGIVSKFLSKKTSSGFFVRKFNVFRIQYKK